jgi:ABC-2 type transport system permease protein
VIVAARFLRDRRRGLFGWTIAIFGYVLMNDALYPSIRGQEGFAETIRNLPDSVRALIGNLGELAITEPKGYLQARLLGSAFPILLCVFAISNAARSIGGSEEDGTLQWLVAQPVARRQIALERAVAWVVLTVVLGIVSTAGIVATAPLVDLLDGIDLANLVAACGASIALALAHGAIAFAVGAATGSRSPALASATAVLVGGYLLAGFGSVTAAIERIAIVSPWHWFLDPIIIADGPTWSSVVPALAVALVAVAVGVHQFDRRDLH